MKPEYVDESDETGGRSNTRSENLRVTAESSGENFLATQGPFGPENGF